MNTPAIFSLFHMCPVPTIETRDAVVRPHRRARKVASDTDCANPATLSPFHGVAS